MAALDFPNAPTVGQQYAAPNGITYQWDGAAWIVTGGPPATPTGPAGGDLAGSTYPNPIIAAAAVTTAKLAPGAALGLNTYALAQGAVMQNGTAEQVLVEITTPVIPTNRPCVVLVWITGVTQCPSAVPPGSVTTTFYLKLGATGVAGTQLQSQRVVSVVRGNFEGDSWTAVLCHYYVGTGIAARLAATGVVTDAGATSTVQDARIMALPFS